ncbi:helix-turn-helix domain-containing protein [Arenibacter sp. BSSL-BM3]|uniref:Helix-turn-helix domain-containing protein n=1 Tax=Arenibacter arenosicollis TaxID=2762274 RepID=A0ABR7QRH9_9FLAO|nr:helix-turn-helix domain-containing protein [Arenibacter arenosicollis]MBC8769664.1 helix-turn-helix domain-containing protein [Arenibacter arenosicollis]
MPANLITTDDLREFKIELLEGMKQLLSKQANGTLKRYLRSSEVMDMLQISAGTLQNLRINGTLPYTKMGGILFYDTEDIQKIMLSNRIHHEY